MSVEIKYNGSSISAGYGSSATESQPVPFFSESKEMIEIGSSRWGQRCNLTLDGQLTGRGNNLVNIYEATEADSPFSDTSSSCMQGLFTRPMIGIPSGEKGMIPPHFLVMRPSVFGFTTD